MMKTGRRGPISCSILWGRFRLLEISLILIELNLSFFFRSAPSPSRSRPPDLISAPIASSRPGGAASCAIRGDAPDRPAASFPCPPASVVLGAARSSTRKAVRDLPLPVATRKLGSPLLAVWPGAAGRCRARHRGRRCLQCKP